MKKSLLTITAVLAFGFSQSQNLINENFDVFPVTWTSTNQSDPVGESTWAQGGGTAFATGGFNGGATSFALVNFNSTTGSGTISNWLITPVINVQNGDVISFYTRSGGLGLPPIYPDRLEIRLSTAGVASVVPSTGATDVGSFTTLALSVNPNLTTTGYPFVWTQYTYTVSGLSTATDVRVAFRYFVTNGGPSGDNSNIIGIDAFSIDRNLSTDDFFAQNFKVYPNPTADVLNVNSATTAIESLNVTDVNGRVVISSNVNGLSQTSVNISDLSAGMYFLTVTSDLGSGTTKIMKK